MVQWNSAQADFGLNLPKVKHRQKATSGRKVQIWGSSERSINRRDLIAMRQDGHHNGSQLSEGQRRSVRQI
jgi:hypothetical protein